MLLSVIEYMREKNIRLKKQELYKIKKEIVDEVGDSEFSEDYMNRVLKDTKSHFFIYYMGNQLDNHDELCGFCILRKIESDKKHKSFVLSLIVVKKELRGNGYGTTLFNTLVHKLSNNTSKDLIIYTHSLEESCIFYKRLGFENTDYICGYMEDVDNIKEDDIIMKYTKNSLS
jgi:ribosomal protein S18 acetylase RimI-like enzyme